MNSPKQNSYKLTFINVTFNSSKCMSNFNVFWNLEIFRLDESEFLIHKKKHWFMQSFYNLIVSLKH